MEGSKDLGRHDSNLIFSSQVSMSFNIIKLTWLRARQAFKTQQEQNEMILLPFKTKDNNFCPRGRRGLKFVYGKCQAQADFWLSFE